MNGGSPTTTRRVRLGRVIAIGVCCSAVLAGGIGARAAYVAWRTPARGYAQDFDANLAATVPQIWPAIKANPALRQLMLERTQAAFLHGGWHAASDVFWHLVHARMEAFAGDEATLACHAAWQDVYRALLPQPHACRVLETARASAVPAGLAAAEIDRATRLCTDAAIEGGELRSLPNPPAHSTWAEHERLLSVTMTSPRPLPADEVAAFAHPQDADDATWCRSRIDQGDNLAKQRSDIAARELRFTYAAEENAGLDPHLVIPVSPTVDPPADLTCAPAGTVFTLSMYSGNGRPITWTSLGRRSWDCALQSSASGLRGVWTSLQGQGNNPLRLMWPLSVGKSAQCSCGRANGSSFRVASYNRYWLPWGWVNAYAIEEDVPAWNGDLIYSVTKYWSPELGFVIGQHTQVVSGEWPDDVAPDWQLVAENVGGK